MSHQQSLPLALRLVLKSQTDTNPALLLLDYGDEAVFADLWLYGLESTNPKNSGQSHDWDQPGQQILIIGNDPPNDAFAHLPESLRGINFRSHFTATSWLAAWKVKFPNAKAAIAVIDPREANLATGAARSLQTILGARDASSQSLIPRAAVLNAPSLKLICQWLHDSAKDTSRETAPHHRELLKTTIWNELTLNREQHHALSNVLGAFLLRAVVGGKQADGGLYQTQQFLNVLAKVCGVGTEAATTGGGGVQAWVEKDLRERFDGAVLIDDIADLWGGFLTAALGGNPAFVRTTPTGQFTTSVVGDRKALVADGLSGLPDRLAKVIRLGRERLMAGDLVPKSDGESDRSAKWESFVLFLDLRLGLDASFHDQLRVVARQLLNSSRNHPWLAADGARAAFERDLDGELGGDTLLPRLISLIDPTLPIVIFSSTHHTDLIGPFRDYGNIITAFRKPTITEAAGRQWRETVDEARIEFRSSLEQAGRIARVRCAFSRLSASPRSETSSAGTALEIFIDESFYRKTNVYAIGCVVLVAESHRRIREFCKAMEDEGVQWGLSCNNRSRHIKETRRLAWNGKRLECARGWYVDRRSLPERGAFLEKFAGETEQRDAWEKIHRLSKKHRIGIFAGALGTPVTDQIGRELRIPSLQGVARDQADELHRELANSLLLLLFTAHPEVSASLRAPNASIAIDVGTRTAMPEDYESRHEDTYQQFGVAYTDHELNKPTLEERCEMWNMALDWAKGQQWWKHGAITARIVRGRIEPNERDLSEWTDTIIWDPRRKMISVSSYDGLNYLRETLARLSPALSPNIVRARGCALFDFDDPGDWLVKLHCFPCFPYQPHYLADWIARSGVEKAGNAGAECALENAFASGFVTDWTARKKALLNAVVSVEGGDSLDGLKAIVKWLELGDDTIGGCRASELLLSKAHESAVKADGNTLRGLFAEGADS
ncbi:MAG TPA: hypothetical protein PLX89_04805 [Verrucomicrobiota bacterium]|nr:hypothetical protein [Verrucomicrobiales bacterium]HRI12306.1 hypothetical protein [Verrucomicrobiota bacterium]